MSILADEAIWLFWKASPTAGSARSWPIVVAVYLGWSFLSGNWGITWIVFPVAALIFGAISTAVKKDE